MDLKSLIQNPKALLDVYKKYPFYATVGLLLILLLIDYFGILRFQLNTLMSLDTKTTKLSMELQTAKTDMQRMPRYRQEVVDRKNQVAEINRKVNSREDVPLVLENISRIANRNDVKIERIMPDTSSHKPVLQNNTGKYFSIPIIIEARSGYHDFARFLNQLEAEGVFLDIPQFTIATNRGDSRKHVIKLTLHTVVFEEAKGE